MMSTDDQTPKGQRVAFDPNERRIIALAKTFPTFEHKPELVEPWTPRALDEWAAIASHGERLVAQFLLAVWNPSFSWQCGRFDVMDALQVWDERHRNAFLTWVTNPWWP